MWGGLMAQYVISSHFFDSVPNCPLDKITIVKGYVASLNHQIIGPNHSKNLAGSAPPYFIFEVYQVSEIFIFDQTNWYLQVSPPVFNLG